jgi:preprotein translocase subunit SecD
MRRATSPADKADISKRGSNPMAPRARSAAATAAALLCCVTLAAWAAAADKPAVKVEFRRAEVKPAEGLTEATVKGTEQKVYLHKVAELTNDDITGAGVIADKKATVVEVELTTAGQKKLAQLTKEHLGKPLAILIDGKVIAAPVVKAEITGNARINGSFTREEAERIVKGIKGK